MKLEESLERGSFEPSHFSSVSGLSSNSRLLKRFELGSFQQRSQKTAGFFQIFSFQFLFTYNSSLFLLHRRSLSVDKPMKSLLLKNFRQFPADGSIEFDAF